MLKTYKKKSDEKIGKHFKVSEFDCPCSCEETLVDDKLVQLLDALREKLDSPISINSGYRCGDRQEYLRLRGYETAKGISTHQKGQAADIKTGRHTGVELAIAAQQVGFKAIGAGKHWIHVDLRADKERRWGYR